MAVYEAVLSPTRYGLLDYIYTLGKRLVPSVYLLEFPLTVPLTLQQAQVLLLP
jgi:hypothetical protein